MMDYRTIFTVAMGCPAQATVYAIEWALVYSPPSQSHFWHAPERIRTPYFNSLRTETILSSRITA